MFFVTVGMTRLFHVQRHRLPSRFRVLSVLRVCEFGSFVTRSADARRGGRIRSLNRSSRLERDALEPDPVHPSLTLRANRLLCGSAVASARGCSRSGGTSVSPAALQCRPALGSGHPCALRAAIAVSVTCSAIGSDWRHPLPGPGTPVVHCALPAAALPHLL